VLVLDTVSRIHGLNGRHSGEETEPNVPPYHTASLTDRLSNVWGNGLEEFLESARKSHDLILIKAPPVLLMPDAIRLARLSDITILVARWRQTRFSAAANAIRMFRDAGIQPGGIVLTNVDLNHATSWLTAGQCYYFTRYRKFYASLSS
jgi:Mrp family chromosome partitioning ATPase